MSEVSKFPSMAEEDRSWEVLEARTLAERIVSPVDVTPPSQHEAQILASALLKLSMQLETLEWFLRHRTADEGMTQWDVYKQIDWSTHPEFAR